LAPVVGAEGDEDGVRLAGDIEAERQVPAVRQQGPRLGRSAVVDRQHVGAAAGRPVERRVGGGADQQALVALGHDAADALPAARVAVRVAGTDEERRPVSDPPRRRTHIRRITSYSSRSQLSKKPLQFANRESY